MGAFNIVRTTAICPACRHHVCIPVQFKYGNTWQYDYHVSDQAKWGGNDIGTPGKQYFETTVNVGGVNVVVRGNVIDGVARIGTASGR